MPQATFLWTLWQALLVPFVSAFARPGHRRFVQWVTALVLNVEELTLTLSVTATDRIEDWNASSSTPPFHLTSIHEIRQ